MENFLEINYEKNISMLLEAAQYCSENFSHEDLINELYNDNDLKKQLCLIELKEIYSSKEADILTFNLTGKPGPIRETASYKILELIQNPDYNNFFQRKTILDIFVKAITDINPSVSRNTIEIIQYVNDKQYLYDSIICEINKTLSEMDDISQSRSYCANKKNFNLYWNLEALVKIAAAINAGEELMDILNKTALSNDYTIREKTAKAANELSRFNPVFSSILNLMENDENIYVRKYL